MQLGRRKVWNSPQKPKKRKQALFWRALLVMLLFNLGIGSARQDSRRSDSHRPRMHSDAMQRDGQKSQATAKEIEKLLSNAEAELRPWATSGVTREMVERVYCFNRWTASMRFQVKNGKLFVTHPDYAFQSRARTTLHQLVHLSLKYSLPDVDMILVTDDFCPRKDIPHKSFDGNYERCSHLAPIFSISRLPEESHCVQVPDFTFPGWPEQFLPPWPLTKSLMQDAADNQPWDGRSDLMFWKGAMTHPERETTVKSQLLQQSGMTQVHFVNFSASETYVSLPGHCHHKYLLHMEGYSYSSRLKYLMACGSPVIYPNKRYTEFWYHMLDETNHVPVDRTSPENQGEPVLTALKKLKKDETKAKSIGKAAQHMVQEVLHQDNIDRYWMELILQYSKLMTFEVEVHPDVLPIDAVIISPDMFLHTDNRTCTYC